LDFIEKQTSKEQRTVQTFQLKIHISFIFKSFVITFFNFKSKRTSFPTKF